MPRAGGDHQRVDKPVSQSFQPIYLAAPTAAGKTGVAIELAQRLGAAEIVNADAYQIYRGIEILAATPTEEERAGVPHHLFGHLSLEASCDAAAFAKLARATIAEVATRAVPIVVGGSGLYLKAITHGLGPTPPGDATLRAELELKSLDELVEQYRQLDPEGAAATNLKNRRYVTRNLEICLLTGQPASELKSQWQNDAPDFTGIYLDRPREEIYARINQRTHQMWAAGVVEQIAAIDCQPSATAAKAIGLAEVQAVIAGEIAEEEAIAAIQQTTRRFAKRQETWFKREPQYRRISCVADDIAASIVDRILEIFPVADLRSFTENHPCQKSRPKTT